MDGHASTIVEDRETKNSTAQCGCGFVGPKRTDRRHTAVDCEFHDTAGGALPLTAQGLVDLLTLIGWGCSGSVRSLLRQQTFTSDADELWAQVCALRPQGRQTYIDVMRTSLTRDLDRIDGAFNRLLRRMEKLEALGATGDSDDLRKHLTAMREALNGAQQATADATH